MINELSRLAEAIKDADICTETWHAKYLTLPKIKADAPCIRILVNNGNVTRLRSVSADTGKNLRKYGNNQGSFPAMNLAPLFRITDSAAAEKIFDWLKADNSAATVNTDEVRAFCTENNWNQKFKNKYKISIIDRAAELKKDTAGSYEPLNKLIDTLKPLEAPDELHRQLCERAFSMIDEGENIRLALQTLFYIAKPDKPDEYGSLSVIFDSRELEKEGVSSISSAFTKGVNAALLAEKAETANMQRNTGTDAFGLPYCDMDETMPKIALPAGFDVTLRTMFSGQPCQYRYGKIENSSYPLSSEKIMEIKTSLEWLSREDNRNRTWVKTGKSEAFFAYFSRITEKSPCTVQTFSGDLEKRESDSSTSKSNETDFLTVSENFTEFITKTKKLDPDNCPEYIQLFALNKYDKARTRISYSRCTTPDAVIERSELWQKAADNIPPLWRLKSPRVLFPLAIAPVMNRIWKQNGTEVSDKYSHTGRYHGIDLFFGVSKSSLSEDLHELVRNSENMAVYASAALRSKNRDSKINTRFLFCLKETLSLMGMYLYWLGIERSSYMNDYPYLLGQLLKLSDAVHELYCTKVRNSVPVQLVGNTMYSAAAEYPLQTLALLGTRMQPYLAWCKTHRHESLEWTDRDNKSHKGLSAGFYLRQYEAIADKLKTAFSGQVRFDAAEKAQLFIGYLASFENVGSDTDDNDDTDTNNENGNEGESENE